MKKYLIHVFYIFIIAFFVTYGKIKAEESQKQSFLAQANAEEAEKNAHNALKMAELAEQAAAEALRQTHLAAQLKEELENCKFSIK